MDSLYLHLLTPNKYQNRYFGVDYFLHLLSGSNPTYKYYSTPLDQNPVYLDGPVSFLEEYYDFLETEIKHKEEGSIIGIQQNPDVYDGLDSIKRLLDILAKWKMGLFLETTSPKLLNDIEALKVFSMNVPLMIAIPISAVKPESDLFGHQPTLDDALKLIQKLKAANISCGVLIKPIIPFVNDGLSTFRTLIQRSIEEGVDFIYPTFSIKFDSKKIKAFYDIIDTEFPALMVKLHEHYGMKHVWESPNMSLLKKHFVIECRKHKVLYAMKDIIHLYKPDLNLQMKLF